MGELEALDDVEASRVDRSGRYFRLTLRPGADRDSVAAKAAAVLGGNASRAEVASGTRWYSRNESVEITLIEIKALSSRFGRRAATEARLDGAQAARLIDALHAELELRIREMHAKGGATREEIMGDFTAKWAELVDAVMRRCGDALDAEEAAAVRASLADPLGGG